MNIDIENYLSNPTKQNIIGLLIRNKSLKYSQLMPPNIDNVLFNYHLQHLVKLGLLTKKENQYSLSNEGLKATSNVTYNGLYFPRFVCRYRMYLLDKNMILFQHRTRTPWYGDTTAVSSKVVQGSNIEEKANIRFKEKTNLEVEMKWIGTIRTMAFNSLKDLVDDSIYFICYATTFSGELKNENDSNDPLIWINIKEAIQIEERNRGSGSRTVEVLERLASENFTPFVFEEIVKAEST